jgi:hypothetical protein
MKLKVRWMPRNFIVGTFDFDVILAILHISLGYSFGESVEIVDKEFDIKVLNSFTTWENKLLLAKTRRRNLN